MKDPNRAPTKTTEIHLARRSPEYWRVTFNHPPLNIFGPETIPQLNEIVTAIETDKHVKVVVFDSAIEGFFLTHYDFLAKLEDTTSLPPGPTGLQPLPDMLVRLSRAPVVSIASIRGRATGVGSELALACDMRFASRERAILSQFEVGAGVVPGGGPMARLPRLMGRGRALEVLLGADDIPGDMAERYGYVNRSLPDAEPRCICGCARNPDRIVRQAGDQRDQALCRRRQFAARLRDRAGVGCVPCLDHAAGRAEAHPGLNGTRVPPTRRCRSAFRALRRASRTLASRRRRKRMSHHASGPDFGFPRGDARLDMTDLYAFPKPGDPGKSILILNVHMSFGLNPPGPTTAEPFAPGALYEIKIDTDGDAIADISYSLQFRSSADGKQSATLRRSHGAAAAEPGDKGEVIVADAPVSSGPEALVTKAGEHRLFAGWRSDPFFFDAKGNFNKMQFTGDDFFADKNVCSIVLEVPNAALGTCKLGLWARTLEKTGEGWVQADRGGRPLQAVFLAGGDREAYLSGGPAEDERFISVFAHELEHTGGYTSRDATEVARNLLPDILPYDPRRPASFPHSGRTLTDDVVDVFFSILTKRKGDGR